MQQRHPLSVEIHPVESGTALMGFLHILGMVSDHQLPLFVAEKGIVPRSLYALHGASVQHGRRLLVPVFRLQQVLPPGCHQIAHRIGGIAGPAAGVGQVDLILCEQRVGPLIVMIPPLPMA